MKLLEDFSFVDDPIETLDDEMSESLPIFGAAGLSGQGPATDFKKLTQDNLLNLQKLSFDFDKLAAEFQQTQHLLRNEKHKGQRLRKKVIQLQDQIRALGHDKEEIVRQYKNADDEVRNLRNEIAKVRDTSATLQSEKFDLSEKFKKSKESEEQYRFQVERFSKLVPDLQNQIEAVEKRYQNSERVYAELLDRYYAFQAEKIRLAELNADLQKTVSHLKSENGELREQLNQVSKQNHQATKEASSVEAVVQSQNRVTDFVNKVEMDSMQKELQDLRVQVRHWESLQKDWEQQKAKWEDRAKDSQRTIHQLKTERDQSTQRLIDVQRNEDQKKQILTHQILDLQNGKRILENKIADLEAAQKKTAADVKSQEDMRMMVAKKSQAIFELEDKLSNLQKQLDTEKAHVAAIEEKNEHLAWTRRSQKSELEKLQAENKALSDKVISWQELSLNKDSRVKELQIEMKGSVTQWESRIKQLQTDLEISQSKVEQQQSTIDSLNARIETNEKQTSEVSKKSSELTATQSELDSKQERLESLQKSLEQREQQFSQYVQLVNNAQDELRSAVSRLDQEMQLSINLNPLKDFIKITEREIDRIDLQLKKTPTISPERIRLETYMDELFEQRVFLKDNIRKINQEADKRRSQLAEIYKSTALNAVPPMPPKVKRDH